MLQLALFIVCTLANKLTFAHRFHQLSYDSENRAKIVD